MFRVLFLFLSFLGIVYGGECQPGNECCMGCILEGEISKKDALYSGFLKCLELLRDRNAKVLVEHTEKEVSTSIFSKWIEHQGGALYSIKSHMEENTNPSLETDEVIAYGNMDECLENLEVSIDFFYLNDVQSYPNVEEIQMHYLEEIQKVYPWLTDNSIILIDNQESAANLAVQFLKEQGWKIVKGGVQVLLVKN